MSIRIRYTISYPDFCKNANENSLKIFFFFNFFDFSLSFSHEHTCAYIDTFCTFFLSSEKKFPPEIGLEVNVIFFVFTTSKKYLQTDLL
jgi:hypothetical protein